MLFPHAPPPQGASNVTEYIAPVNTEGPQSPDWGSISKHYVLMSKCQVYTILRLNAPPTYRGGQT